jgi:hypothetical protein
MKKLFKWLGIFLSIIVVIIFCGVGYIKLFLPNVGDAPDIKIDSTPERIERGKYLAHSVMVCMDCHSKRDWTQYSGPIVPGTLGQGGEKFDPNFGFPGTFYSRNITPFKLKSWTDGEIYRAITTGQNKNGEPLFPLMPYNHYGQLDNEDLYSVIAYIRTLAPIKKDDIKPHFDFPMNIIINTIPHKASPAPKPDPSDSIAYGRYLVMASGCIECHTREEKGQIIEEFAYSGGREFNMPAGILRSANITPDASGLGYWSKEKFVQTFKQYKDSNYHSPVLNPMTDMNTIMPWTMYSDMTESDLSSIYQYLRTVKPIRNEVIKFSANAVASK